MIHKNRYNRRKTAYYKSKRKVGLVKEIYGEGAFNIKTNNSILRFSKAKIHCSCCLCSMKSKYVGKVKTNSHNTYSISDRKKLTDYHEQLKEWKLYEKFQDKF